MFFRPFLLTFDDTEMKTKLMIILTVLLCACVSNSINKVGSKEKIINIIDKKYYFFNTFEFHKDKEVKIYDVGPLRPNDKYPNYGLYVYRKGVGQIGQFICWGHYKYDKATYKWLNDTALSIKMYNSINNLSDGYTFTYSLNNHTETFGINSN